MKRVLVGGFHHESDTFNPIITNKDDIYITNSEELLLAKGSSSASGIVKTLQENNIEVIPTFVARAVPNGVWDKDYYCYLKEMFLNKVKESLPLDAFCLALHGSMIVDEIGEAEGDLLEAIHRICPDVKVFASLDMHATISEKMMKYASCYVGYKCAPHTDTYKIGVHAASMCISYLENKINPTMAAVKVPFLIAGEQSETSVEPMLSLIKRLREEELNDDILACSYLLGFPWADTKDSGVTCIVVTNNDDQKANDKAFELASLFYDTRDKFGFYNETREVEDAIDKAFISINEGVFPLVLSDSGDNPTAGSSGDVTNFLKSIIKDARLTKLDPPLVYQAIYDKNVVNQAFEVGVGNILNTSLGAFYDREKSSPIKISAKVKAISNEFNKQFGANLALLDVNGIDVVVTDKHVGCYDLDMMRCLNICPENRKCIVVKLGYLEPEIRSIAAKSILVLTDGSSNEVFSKLEYKNIIRPIYPLDKDFIPNIYRI